MKKLKFVFKDEFKDIISTTTYDYSSEKTKGIYTLSNKNIYINLSAPIWTQLYNYAGEYMLICELSNTIQHEYLHFAINTEHFNEYSENMEEQIVEKMIG